MSNPVIAVIVLLAVAVYALLIKLCFLMPTNKAWVAEVITLRASLRIMITALPLLGLLGTIVGLMDTFAALSFNIAAELETLMSNGISDALKTTQWGLSFVVPAMVLHNHLLRRFQQYQIEIGKR